MILAAFCVFSDSVIDEICQEFTTVLKPLYQVKLRAKRLKEGLDLLEDVIRRVFAAAETLLTQSGCDLELVVKRILGGVSDKQKQFLSDMVQSIFFVSFMATVDMFKYETEKALEHKLVSADCMKQLCSKVYAILYKHYHYLHGILLERFFDP